MRYLIDTCVLVSALRSKRGASNLVLRKVLQGQFRIVMHYKLLSEYRDVLLRLEQQRVIPYTETQLESLLAALVGIADEVQVRYLWRPNLRDESDNFVMEIALAAQPCTIVTHNVRDFARGELRFPGTLIRRPRDILLEGLQ